MADIFLFSKFLSSCIYFFLPAYFANVVPPIAARLPVLKELNWPVDAGLKLRSHYLLGDHKTWRGVICAILVGTLVVLVQGWLYNFQAIREISLVDYSQLNLFLFGLLISAGAMFGDLSSAFIKRRLDIKPGGIFIPWDQTNYVIGSFIFVEPYVKLGADIWLTIFIATFFIHISFNRLGYHLGVHQAKW